MVDEPVLTPAVYANYFEVRYTAQEFLLDFGQYYPDEIPRRCHTRLVVSLESVALLSDMLAQALARHRVEMSAAGEGLNKG